MNTHLTIARNVVTSQGIVFDGVLYAHDALRGRKGQAVYVTASAAVTLDLEDCGLVVFDADTLERLCVASPVGIFRAAPAA